MKNLKKLDGSFNIVINGMPYNTIQGDKYFNETKNLYNSNPELFEIEQEIVINVDFLKTKKLQDLKKERDKYKINNNYNNQNIVLNILNGLGNYTEQERFDCKIFFNDLIHKYDNYKEQINSCTTKEELDLITITFGE